MQDVDRITELHGVDGTVSIAIRIFDHFQDTRRPKALERFCLLMLLTDLRLVQGETKRVLYSVRHHPQVLPGRGNPIQRFHGSNYAHTGIIRQPTNVQAQASKQRNNS